jgi:glycerol kinase
MSRYCLAIDQGTTSSRAILFTRDARPAFTAQRELPQHYPASGWVEHEPEDIWQTTLSTCRDVMAKAGATPADIAAIGVTNQRETVIVWDRQTGEPIHRAIVWQDRRTADICEALRQRGVEPMVRARTGLLLDPYFSATKIAWILDNVPGARDRADRGELAFGTVDTFLLWRLTGGQVHATDATNASRTQLLNIGSGEWDDELLALFNVPGSVLPQVRDSSADFGQTSAGLLGAPIPIRGVAGDQQAAMIGQACFKPGMIKATYGTGCFVLLNTGDSQVASQHRLLTTIAYQLDGRRFYALEGAIFVAGAAVQWLRDGLGVLKDAADSGGMAAAADPAQEDVLLVPAFVGLGAPHWSPNARGALLGLTRATGPNELARAALDSACLQTCDLLDAMRADWPGLSGDAAVLRVDGGMSASDWTMQRLADLSGAQVDRPQVLETTALGAAYLAGMSTGFFPGLQDFAAAWPKDKHFSPAMGDDARARKRKSWRRAVSAVLSMTDDGSMPG